MPSNSDLTYFLEVVATSNLSRAAERLGISQPSLSLAMQRLEHAVGTPLFNRSTKGVSLTPAGHQVFAHTKSLLEKWDQVRNEALASHQNIQGRFTLGCHPSVALYSLPGFMGRLLEDHPKLEVQLFHDHSRKITEQVVQMKIDIGIVVNPVRHPDLIIHKLCDDEVTFWVGRGHRRIQNTEEGDGVLICDPELLQSQDLLKRMKKVGFHFARTISSSSLEVITELTASGTGVGIIPGRVAATAFKPLQKIPQAPIFRDEICLLYRIEKKGVRALRTLADSIIASFKKGG